MLRTVIDSHNRSTSFDDAWTVPWVDSKHLRGFCGGLVTVIASTSTVESDFSILKLEMDENRTDMVDVLYTNQCGHLYALVVANP